MVLAPVWKIALTRTPRKKKREKLLATASRTMSRSGLDFRFGTLSAAKAEDVKRCLSTIKCQTTNVHCERYVICLSTSSRQCFLCCFQFRSLKPIITRKVESSEVMRPPLGDPHERRLLLTFGFWTRTSYMRRSTVRR